MEQEIWKDIEGYEGLYQVSSLGEIMSLGRTTTKYMGKGVTGTYFRKGRILKQNIIVKGGKSSYLQVDLCKDGNIIRKSVHRVVAITFIPNPDNLLEVNHKNGNKTDNRVENLEWTTGSGNRFHSYQLGLQKPIKGKENILSKKIVQMSLNDMIIKEFDCIKDAAKETGVHRSNISSCALGRKHHSTAGGFKWRYAL